MSPVMTAFSDGTHTKLLPGPSAPCTPPVIGNSSPSSVSTGAVSSSGRTGSGPGILLPYVGDPEFLTRRPAGLRGVDRRRQRDDLRLRERLLQHRQAEEMIGMRMRRVNRDEPLLRLEDFGRELMRLAQRELRVDDQHVPLADDHRRVDVVADLPAAGVHFQCELRLRGARRDQRQRHHHAHPQSACPHSPPRHAMRFGARPGCARQSREAYYRAAHAPIKIPARPAAIRASVCVAPYTLVEGVP